MKEIKILISEYIFRVENALLQFERKIGNVHPLVAWRKNIIPQKGQLSKDINYEFHGIGCLLVYPDCEVDFDFSSDIKSIGFDLWRLSQFANSFKNNPYYENKSSLEKDFRKALDNNLIKKSSEENCRLYFLN